MAAAATTPVVMPCTSTGAEAKLTGVAVLVFLKVVVDVVLVEVSESIDDIILLVSDENELRTSSGRLVGTIEGIVGVCANTDSGRPMDTSAATATTTGIVRILLAKVAGNSLM
ncbi:hypothetical protein THASP1DRAFT_27766 [Thamnocephalis sphaerospora]|uniref:Uncharacterized protein n=1 Tax=Thamnocephalis sphaerospora TaxID=78915 RepID=A0A4V1IXB1_9FUNG|nr:hypothetical protein THASP1DRAFT_27766 [Thamnocephalis sphaerospora]|eukprot:RKP10439.1 hypothetical protein THASP1DRAFT_27766 [Thamnocephalis sphaerospora]